MWSCIKRSVRLGSTIAMLAVVAACGHTPVSSMIKLRNFDPTTTDVDKFSIAVLVPDRFKIGEKGVSVTIGLRKKDGSDTRYEKFVLTDALNGDDQRKLRKLNVANHNIIAYRVHPDDVERFNAIRSFSLQVKKTKEWNGSFAVGTEVCRVDKERPKSVLITTYLNSSETNEYVPFIVDFDVMEQMSPDEFEDTMPVCKGNT